MKFSNTIKTVLKIYEKYVKNSVWFGTGLKRKQQGNIWMYMQSNFKKSQNQAEKLKKLSDARRKVNFQSSQVEALRNRKLSN